MKKINKIDQTTESEIKSLLSVASGNEASDLLIKNVNILDLVNGETYLGNIAISGRLIAGVGNEYTEGKTIIDGSGLFATAGFIDSHLHIESSLMNPFEFQKMTLPLGTTTAVCDPHEITNVLGKKGFDWFIRCAEKMDQNLFVQVSSCVPALLGFETNGGEFTLDDMSSVMDNTHVLGMGEMMNFPGVIAGDENVLAKLNLFQKHNMGIDGHCPMMRGKDLNAYIGAGVRNCHETVGVEEAKEKLQKGMAVMIREGSVAKNLNTLAPVVNEMNSIHCLLCTDDRNPRDLYNEGDINYLIHELINKHQVPIHIAYRMASYSAANHYGIKRLGLIAPGMQADIVLLSSLENVEIKNVLIKAKPISELNLETNSIDSFNSTLPPMENTIKRKMLSQESFNFELKEGSYNVIQIVPNEIITEKNEVDFDGSKFSESDVLKMSVIERYGNESSPSIGFVKGFNLTGGALASSVAHDCHNIIVVGSSDKDMAVAVNALIKSGGGFCVASEGKVDALLDLPIAGLMGVDCAEVINEKLNLLRTSFKKLGVNLEEPFLQLAFLALPVIPSLKLTDKGLFDVTKFEYISLLNS